MKQTRKFLGLPGADQWLLIEIAILMVGIRLGLRFIPYQTLVNLMMKSLGTKTMSNPKDADRIVWAVSVVGRRISAATCLVQALTTQVLLARHGQRSNLRIGVAKDNRGNLKAHAWVEYRERIIIGNAPDISVYTPLPSLPGDRA